MDSFGPAPTGPLPEVHDLADDDVERLVSGQGGPSAWFEVAELLDRIRMEAAVEPDDLWVRTHVAAASVAARKANLVPDPTAGRSGHPLRAGAVAAATTTLVATMGFAAADTLPRPIQSVAAHVASLVGVTVPDGHKATVDPPEEAPEVPTGPTSLDPSGGGSPSPAPVPTTASGAGGGAPGRDRQAPAAERGPDSPEAGLAPSAWKGRGPGGLRSSLADYLEMLQRNRERHEARTFDARRAPAALPSRSGRRLSFPATGRGPAEAPVRSSAAPSGDDDHDGWDRGRDDEPTLEALGLPGLGGWNARRVAVPASPTGDDRADHGRSRDGGPDDGDGGRAGPRTGWSPSSWRAPAPRTAAPAPEPAAPRAPAGVQPRKPALPPTHRGLPGRDRPHR
jgi:hypothetical protein